MSKLTVAGIRAANLDAGHHFFDRETMRFFGDTVRSFATCEVDGKPGLRRVRPRRDRDGRSLGGVGDLYSFDAVTGDVRSYQEPQS